MLRTTLLSLSLVLGVAPAALAQASHFQGIPVKDFATIQVNYFDDGAGTITKQWTEKRYGTSNTVEAETYTPSKKETFVITDAEFTVRCAAPSTTAPLFSPLINDGTGTGWLYPTRFRPTLATPGQESIHVSFTSGSVLPPNFQLAFPVMAAGNYTVFRAIFFGYYTT